MQLNIDLDTAIRADILAFNGSQTELSQQVCGSQQGLRHKVAHFRGANLHPDELLRLQQVSGSAHTIQEMARAFGGVFFRLPENVSLEQVNTNLYIELGELHHAMQTACANGVITIKERVLLERKAQWTVAALFAWLMAHFQAFGE